jgi:hypothetical protein
LFRDFFFGETIIYEIRSRIVEVEGIHPSGEERSQSSVSFHLCKNLISQFKPLFFGILSIEDAK